MLRTCSPVRRVLLGCCLLLGTCLALGLPPQAWAAISPVGASFSGDGNSSAVGSLSLSNPGSQAGDVLLAQVVVGDGGVSIAAPAGWTSYALNRLNGLTQQLFYRVAVASEPASYSFSFGAVSARASGGLLVGRGIAITAGSPIAQSLGNSGSGATFTALSASVTANNSRILRFFAFAQGNNPLNGPVTQHYAPATGAGPNGVAASASSIAQAATGVTGSATATAAGSSDDWLAVTVVLAPAAPPVLSWSLDESAWNGTAGEVLETSGNNLNGTAFNSANTDGVAPALATDSSGRGTCRYGAFNSTGSTRKYVQVADNTLLDMSTFTVSVWVYNTARPSSGLMSILSKDTNYEFHIRPNGVINWWWRDSAGDIREFDSVGTVPLNQWTNVTIRFVAGDQRIYINGVRNSSATYSLVPQTNREPLQIGNDLNVAGRYWRGNLDEVRVYSSALSDAEILALVSERHPCASAAPDHLEILHDGIALTCQPETVTLRACANASCSQLYSGIVSATLSPGGWVGGNTRTFSGGQTTARLQVNSAGPVTLGVGAITPVPANSSFCLNGSTLSCSLDFKEAGFIFDVPTLLANKTSAAVSLTAVRKDATSQLCVPAFDSVSRDLQFWSSYVDPATGTRSVTVNGTPVSGSSPGSTVNLSFDGNARTSIVVNYADAGQMNLEARYSGSTDNGDAGLQMSGSDQFVVRPAGLCVYSDTANSACASGDASCSAFVAAGDPFRLRIKGAAWQVDGDTDLCAGNGDTPNYRQAGIALSSNLVAPLPGSNGTLALSSVDLTAADGGEKILGNQTQSEVGVFSFTATPPANGYFAETVAAGSSANIGRFIPAYLSATGSASLTPSCGAAFSYQGQPMAFATAQEPSLSVTGRNRAGNVTTNYDRGSFWKLAVPARDSYLSVTGTPALDAPGRLLALGTVSVSQSGADTGDGTRSYRWSGETLEYSPALLPSAAELPFTAAIRLGFSAAALTDGDGVCSGNGSACQAFSFDFANTPGSQVRLGRLSLGNAHGSELQGLSLPWRLETWQAVAGGSFQVESQDACSSAAVLGAPTLSNYLGNLAAGETTLSLSGPSAGLGQLALSAPGAGNDGSVQGGFTALPNWLHYDWDGSGRRAASGLASFGIYQGAAPLIFRREVYGQ